MWSGLRICVIDVRMYASVFYSNIVFVSAEFVLSTAMLGGGW